MLAQCLLHFYSFPLVPLLVSLCRESRHSRVEQANVEWPWPLAARRTATRMLLPGHETHSVMTKDRHKVHRPRKLCHGFLGGIKKWPSNNRNKELKYLLFFYKSMDIQNMQLFYLLHWNEFFQKSDFGGNLIFRNEILVVSFHPYDKKSLHI